MDQLESNNHLTSSFNILLDIPCKTSLFLLEKKLTYYSSNYEINYGLRININEIDLIRLNISTDNIVGQIQRIRCKLGAFNLKVHYTYGLFDNGYEFSATFTVSSIEDFNSKLDSLVKETSDSKFTEVFEETLSNM